MAAGIGRHEALWGIPEHQGWQFIHVHEVSEGRKREWARKRLSSAPETLTSFRDRIPIREENKDDLLRI